MDCIYLPFFLCASCCCRSWVEKKRKEEEHARAKKNGRFAYEVSLDPMKNRVPEPYEKIGFQNPMRK